MIYYNIGGELKHYGIKDMKWYQRRYQYYDGTYTPEGKARRRKDIAGAVGLGTAAIASRKKIRQPIIENRKVTKNSSDEAKRAAEIAKKPMDQRTNEEIKFLNERVRLENELKSLNPDAVERGRKAIETTSNFLKLATGIGASAVLLHKYYGQGKAWWDSQMVNDKKG